MSQTELELLITAKTDELRNEISGVQRQMDRLTRETEKASRGLGAGFKSAIPDISKFALGAGAASVAVAAVGTSIQNMVAKEQSLAEFSAITGVTGAKLQQFGDAATELSNKFGTSTLENIESFKGVLGKLGPDFASSTEAVALMGENINLLAMAGGITAPEAMDALTAAMLQFSVDLSDPMAAAREATRMMNAMAAGAQAGSVEIPGLKDGMVQVGSAVHSMGISFEDAVSVLEAFGTAGKVGSEGGVAFRNMLAGITSDSKPAIEAFEQMGINQKELAELMKKDAGAAFDMLRDGLQKLGGGFEQNTAIANIWGKENAVAIGKVVKMGGFISKMTKEITGTNSALEQANIVMDTTQAKWGRFAAFMENSLVGVLERGRDAVSELYGAFESLFALDFAKATNNATKFLTEIVNFSTLGLGDKITQWVSDFDSLNDALGLNAVENKQIAEAARDAAKGNEQFVASTFGSIGAAQKAVEAIGKQNEAIEGQLAAVTGKKKKGGKESPLAGTIGAMNVELGKLNDQVINRLRPGSDAFLEAARKAQLLENAIALIQMRMESLRDEGVPLEQALESALDTAKVEQFDDFFEQALVNIEDGIEEMTKQVDAAYSVLDEQEKARLEEEKRLVQERMETIELYANAAKQFGAALGNLFKGGEDGAKEALKGVLNMVINAVEGMVMAAAAAAAAKGVISWGFSTFADIPLMASALAGLEVARAMINSFAVGTASVPRDMPAMVHEGETIVPKTFADSIRSGELALVGSDRTKAYTRKGSRTQTIKAKISRSSFDSDVGAAMYEGSRGMK